MNYDVEATGQRRIQPESKKKTKKTIIMIIIWRGWRIKDDEKVGTGAFLAQNVVERRRCCSTAQRFLFPCCVFFSYSNLSISSSCSSSAVSSCSLIRFASESGRWRTTTITNRHVNHIETYANEMNSNSTISFFFVSCFINLIVTESPSSFRSLP